MAGFDELTRGTPRFDKIVVLLVDKRIQERERLRNDIVENMGQEPEFFVVGDGDILPKEEYSRIDVPMPRRVKGHRKWKRLPHSYNAFLSFQAIIKNGQEKGHKNILIFEDDIEFVPGFKDKFAKSCEALPSNWDLFYLGCSHRLAKTIKISPELLRIKGSCGFHAVAIASRIFPMMLSLPIKCSIDMVVAETIQQSNANLCFACWPNLVLQKPGFSCCEEFYVDRSAHWNLMGSLCRSWGRFLGESQ